MLNFKKLTSILIIAVFFFSNTIYGDCSINGRVGKVTLRPTLLFGQSIQKEIEEGIDIREVEKANVGLIQSSGSIGIGHSTDFPEYRERLVDWIKAKFGRGISILSVAAGRGDLELALQKTGNSVTALEYFEPFVNEMKAKGVKNVIQGDARLVMQDKRLMNQEQKFDLIIFSECLGTIGLNIIDKAGKFLKDNGTMLVIDYKYKGESNAKILRNLFPTNRIPAKLIKDKLMESISNDVIVDEETFKAYPAELIIFYARKNDVTKEVKPISSPFSMADGSSIAWVDEKGRIRFNSKIEDESEEFRAWNQRHEQYHQTLEKQYPDTLDVVKEITAIALAFKGMTDIKDPHLKAILTAIDPELNKAPASLFDETFLINIAKFISQISPTLRNQLLDSNGQIKPARILEARNIISNVHSKLDFVDEANKNGVSAVEDWLKQLRFPIIFESFYDTVNWIKSNIPNGSKIRILPFMWEQEQEVTKEKFLSESITRLYRKEGEVWAALTVIDDDGKNVYAVLISEMLEEHPEPLEGLTVGYHMSSIDKAIDIINQGIYGVPGRATFCATQEHYETNASEDDVVLVFKLLNRDIVIGDPLPERNFIAPAFCKEKMGVSLPERLRKNLERQAPRELQNYDFSAILLELHRSVLLLGEKAGFLIHFPPESIDIEETLLLNLKHMKEDKLLPSVFKELLLAVKTRIKEEVFKRLEAEIVSADDNQDVFKLHSLPEGKSDLLGVDTSIPFLSDDKVIKGIENTIGARIEKIKDIPVFQELNSAI